MRTELDACVSRHASQRHPLDVQRAGGRPLVRAPGLPDLALTPQDGVTFTSPAGPVTFLTCRRLLPRLPASADARMAAHALNPA